MEGTAVLFTVGALDRREAKTAHGLIRGSDRFQVLGVVDRAFAGRDAGEVLDGKTRNIPVFADLASARAAIGRPVEFAVVGVATPGGVVTPELRALAAEALQAGMSVVNGLHDAMSDMPELAALATRYGGRIVDVRKPKSRDALRFWSGAIARVRCPKVAILGTDCSIGKRTTARYLVEDARAAGVNAHMIYTGQTGWMQGGKYGFILDSTLNDFVSGELEHAIVSCYDNESPDLIVIEGQAALRNPSGPCGAEFLVSGRANAVVLQHHATRTHYHGYPEWGEIFPLKDEIALVAAYGVPVVGVALNADELGEREARDQAAALEQGLGLPVVLPLYEGVGRVLDALRGCFALAGSADLR